MFFLRPGHPMFAPVRSLLVPTLTASAAALTVPSPAEAVIHTVTVVITVAKAGEKAGLSDRITVE